MKKHHQKACLPSNETHCMENQNNGFTAQVIQKHCTFDSQESDGKLSEQGFESVRSSVVPKIEISKAIQACSVTSSAPTSPRLDLT